MGILTRSGTLQHPGYVDQVVLFVDQMGISSVPLVGHGLGGVVGLHFALTHPERVEQVLATNVPLVSQHIDVL